MLGDVFRFRRRLQKINQVAKHSDKQAHAEKLAQLSREIKRSMSTALSRKQNLPEISYPDVLPIAQKSDLIKKTIQQNQVTILCGETGSGKTTKDRKSVV